MPVIVNELEVVVAPPQEATTEGQRPPERVAPPPPPGPQELTAVLERRERQSLRTYAH